MSGNYVLEFVKQNMVLIAMAVISGVMLIMPGLRRGGGNQVSPAEATLLINRQNAIVLDVRDEQEFAAGHIPDARHIPVTKLAERLGELEKFKEKTIVVNCASGVRSGKACEILQKAGFSKVHNLAGGVGAWEQAGLPVKRKGA